MFSLLIFDFIFELLLKIIFKNTLGLTELSLLRVFIFLVDYDLDVGLKIFSWIVTRKIGLFVH
jgi:hypothetical protein